MKKIWVKKFKSFEEAEKADQEYYSKMSPKKLQAIMEFHYKQMCKFKGAAK